MEKLYCLLWRCGIFFHLAFAFVLVSANLTLGQKKTEVIPGIVRIKVTEELAARFEQTQRAKSASDILITGVARVDEVHRQFKVRGVKRVFRPSGKYEAKHRKYGLHLWYEVPIDSSFSVEALVAAYKGITGIERSEPVYKKTNEGDVGTLPYRTMLATLPRNSNDPFLNRQWHYNNTGGFSGTPGADIKLLRAWELETGKSDVVVAVVDGGIQVDHPDLSANMWVNTDEIAGNKVDDDHNGYVDDVHGYNFAYDRGPVEPSLHGTHVGGTVAATSNNRTGVAGVAGGSGVGDGARLMTCAIFSEGGPSGGIPESYTYSADNGAVISQNSWGYFMPGAFEQVVLDAIDYFIAEAGKDENGNQTGPMKGGIVIFAAGNSNTDEQWYPGYYAATVAVAATNRADIKADYSNYGAWVDISAPGGESTPNGRVYSTLPTSRYGELHGTSMACPHVSGTAALIVSKYGGPGFTPGMLRDRLVSTTDKIDAQNPAYIGKLGTGRLNAYTALQENDQLSPERITDLAPLDVKPAEITLKWTAPADAGSGSAFKYDIRYSTQPITEANFNAATKIVNVPVPKPRGEEETFTFTSLTPTTAYYFAIKSFDFFGTASSISNVVEQVTAPAATIKITPPGIFLNMKTAQMAWRILTITNPGSAPLTFKIEKTDGGNFGSLSPGEGTVQPNDTLEIRADFNTYDLPAGLYTQRYAITHNAHPANPVNLFLQVNVTNNGAPIAAVVNDTIDFGVGYPGVPIHQTVTIHNDGSEPLKLTGVTSENPVFTTSFTDTITVAPFEDGTFIATFTGVAIRSYSARIMIQTNDPRRPTVRVRLLAKCMLPPNIVVTPPSLHASQHVGKKTSLPVTIRNTGASDLKFSTKLAPQDTSQVLKMLILTPDGELTALEEVLGDLPGIETSIFPQDMLSSIELSHVTSYDVILVNSWYPWKTFGNFQTPGRVGDLLADYIDQGGKVIVNLWAYSGYSNDSNVDGRFMDEHYGPFTKSKDGEFSEKSLGVVLDPDHPVMVDVTSLQCETSAMDLGLSPNATEIARWDDGRIFIAANQNVVGFNLLLFQGFSWSGDLQRLYHNAVTWLVHSSFASVTPADGTIAAGTEKQIDVTFDATLLKKAGTYSTVLHIHHNVPGKDPVSVPLTFDVLGPEFTTAPDSVYAEIENGETSTRTVTLYNNGFSDHTFTAQLDTAAFVTVSPTNGSIAAGDSATFTLSFNTRDLEFGEYRSLLSIKVDSADLTVPVVMAVVADPAIVIEPTVLQTTLGFGEDTVRYFRIRNTGGRPLYYNLDVIGAENGVEMVKLLTEKTTDQKSRAQVKLLTKEMMQDKSKTTLSVMSGTTLLEEDFESDVFPPSGWNVIDNEGYGAIWNFASVQGEGNYCGTGEAAMAASYVYNEVEIDTELRTPEIFVKGYKKIALQFNANHWGGTLDVDILVRGQTTWKNILHWPFGGHGGEFSLPGESVNIGLDSLLEGASSFQVRWRHYIPTSNDYDYYSQIDDVVILADPVEWLTVSPASGVVPVGEAVDIAARFHAANLEPKTYVAGILVHSNAVDDPLVGVVASLQVLKPAVIHVTPDSVYQEVAIGGKATQQVTIANTGPSRLKFAFEDQVVRRTLATGKGRLAPSAKRTSPAMNTLKLDDIVAIPRSRFTGRVAAAARSQELYATNFEDFYPGEIDGQDGWWADPGAWSIEDDRPFSGAQHFKGVSDGFGIAVAGTPYIGETFDEITSTTMFINLDSTANVTWQIIPQAPIIGWVVTRFDVSANGGMRALVQDSLDVYTSYWVDIPVPRPKGYFELRIDVERSTEKFSIYFNNERVFRGDCFANFIEEVAILSRMETAGPSLFIDNVAIHAGIPATTWVNADPVSGVVAAGGALPVNINFDATELGPGTYRKTFTIASNDPEKPYVDLPVTMRVVNLPPVIDSVKDTVVAQGGAIDLTFTATDPDGTVQSVKLVDAPPFAQRIEGGGASATYRFSPPLMDEPGEYVVTVLATDNSGATASATFRLTVLPYGISNFSVVDTRTGVALFDFKDSVTFDAGDPDFIYQNIRANTQPGTVGSVRFFMDDVLKNTANKAPYMFHSTALRSLTAGGHIMGIEVFTRPSGAGLLKDQKKVVVRVINTTAVTSFEVVNPEGQVLQELHHGDVLNVLDPVFKKMNIRANVTEGSAVGSVRFWLNNSVFRTDNAIPYTLAANNATWWGEEGVYTVSATPYSKVYGGGVPGESLSVSFSIVKTAPNGRSLASEQEATQSSLGQETHVKLYPVPAQYELRIQWSGELPVQQNVQLTIRNVHGQVLYNTEVPTSTLNDHVINLEKASLTSGVYYLQLQTPELNKSLRFIKE